jgi:hypothetical protein
MVDQFVAAAEIHWSTPCGNPLSNGTCVGIDRVLTRHEPSSIWWSSKYRTPR